jgi:hypothetical protein
MRGALAERANPAKRRPIAVPGPRFGGASRPSAPICQTLIPRMPLPQTTPPARYGLAPWPDGRPASHARVTACLPPVARCARLSRLGDAVAVSGAGRVPLPAVLARLAALCAA